MNGEISQIAERISTLSLPMLSLKQILPHDKPFGDSRTRRQYNGEPFFAHTHTKGDLIAKVIIMMNILFPFLLQVVCCDRGEWFRMTSSQFLKIVDEHIARSSMLVLI